MLRSLFIVRVVSMIRRTLPSFVWSSTLALLPVSFLISFLEVFGLVMIIPVLEIMLSPDRVQSNRILNYLFVKLNSPPIPVFIVYLLGAVVLFFIFKNVLFYLASKKQARISFDVAARLSTLQFERYLYEPFINHVNHNSSILLRKIIEIPYNFTSGIMLPLVVLFNELLIALIIVVAICLYNTQLFLSMVVLVSPFLFFYIKTFRASLIRASKNRDTGHTEMFRVGRQSMDSFREIMVFNKFHFFIPRFSDSVRRFSAAMSEVYHLNAFSPRIIEILAVLSVFGIFGVGVAYGYEPSKLASFLAAFAIAAYRLIPSINKIILSYNNIRSVEFVFQHFDPGLVNFRPRTSTEEVIPPISLSEVIILDGVSLRFNEKVILENVSMKIQRGDVVGIVGKSGSGKTTLINVLLGLLPPDIGKVTVDGVEINPENLNRWHKTISLVPQSPVLIEGTIVENVAFGFHPEDVDLDAIHRALEGSGLREFVMSLPDRLNTMLSDKTLNISGGQKQRLAIARALYHNGDVLIFDEATSALDPETEVVLTETIRKLSLLKYTIIIIAHRQETLKHCNSIYRLRDGKLSEPLKFGELYGTN
jgi:ATP-binding cassette, subfamily B, bacterial PglK